MKRLLSILMLLALSAPRVASAADALLVLIDNSSSMASGNKYATASQAIVSAFDQDAFDPLELGLIAAPSGSVTGPACVFNLPVECSFPNLPQVAIGPAGAKATAGAGARQQILQWLQTHSPNGGASDAFPLYAATQSALGALQTWPGAGRRILVIITDGGISCGQLAARAGYGDCNGCDHEWENPQNIATLVATAQAHATLPVETFIIGVPGASTFDASGCNFPPYHMRRALSAIAASGSPTHVPGGCDGVYTLAGGDPVTPCHTDLTLGNFSATTVAGAISNARTAVLGTVGVPLRDGAANGLFLAAPRPNPTSGRAMFRFGLPRAGDVTLSVHDVSGRLVREVAHRGLEAGAYSIEWDLQDRFGARVPSGMYPVRLTVDGEVRLSRLSVVR